MGRTSVLLGCLVALIVVAQATARTDAVQIGLEPSYGGLIGGNDWVRAVGRTTVASMTLQNVTRHGIRDLHVRVLLPGMRVIKRWDQIGTARVPIRRIPGGVTYTIPRVDPLEAPAMTLRVSITAKPGVLECPTVSASYGRKSATWADRGWCWTQAPPP